MFYNFSVLGCPYPQLVEANSKKEAWNIAITLAGNKDNIKALINITEEEFKAIEKNLLEDFLIDPPILKSLKLK